MKKIIIAVAAMVFSTGVFAQDQGIKMYNYERYESARTALEPQAASNAMANYYLGLSQIGLGQLDAAKATFGKHPEDAANMAGLARVAFEQKNVAEGNKITATVAGMAKKKNWEPLLYAADAITYSEGGDYMQAIAWYKKALETAPDDAQLLIGLGDAYRKVPNGGGNSMTNYEKVTSKNPNNSLAFSRIGSLWYAARNYELALENYAKAKDADPSNPLPYRDLANAFYRSGSLKKALENIQKFRELSDKSPEVEEQYLDILYLTKDYTNAIQQAEELIKAGGAKPKPRFFGIVAYSNLEMDKGDSVKALDYVRKYFAGQKPERIGPADYMKYGMIALKNKLEDTAEVYFNKSVELDTTIDKATNMRKMAAAFKDAKSYQKAAVWYGKLANSSDKATATDYFYWGYYHYVNSYNLDIAGKAFEQMESKFPDQPTATYYRAVVAAGIDSNAQTGTAIPHFTKWLETADNEKYTKKKDQLMKAYQYMAAYYYNKNDKANLKKNLDEIEKLDPENAFLKQLREYEKTMKS